MTPNLRNLATVGAQAHLDELRAERDALLKMFPELRGAQRGRRPAVKVAAPPKPTRKRKPMSAAQKKAVGLRMRAYWAKRRAANAGGTGEPTQTESAASNSSLGKSGRKAGRKPGRKK